MFSVLGHDMFIKVELQLEELYDADKKELIKMGKFIQGFDVVND